MEIMENSFKLRPHQSNGMADTATESSVAYVYANVAVRASS